MIKGELATSTRVVGFSMLATPIVVQHQFAEPHNVAVGYTLASLRRMDNARQIGWQREGAVAKIIEMCRTQDRRISGNSVVGKIGSARPMRSLESAVRGRVLDSSRHR